MLLNPALAVFASELKMGDSDIARTPDGVIDGLKAEPQHHPIAILSYLDMHVCEYVFV
jgi:hypothetical protein